MSLCSTRSWFRRHQTILLTGVVAFAFTTGLVPVLSSDGLMEPAAAHAQNYGQRIVRGYVLDANSAPLVGATVFLRDLKTKSIRSYTSAGDGKFQFTQVNMAEDHELWAEKDGKKSLTKTVSEWDTRKDFVAELKVK